MFLCNYFKYFSEFYDFFLIFFWYFALLLHKYLKSDHIIRNVARGRVDGVQTPLSPLNKILYLDHI